MTAEPADHPRILIIDDDAVVREVLEGICCELGWNVVTAATRDDAILAAGLHQTDLVLLDFNLDDTDALTVIPELRMVSPNTPIVVITGQAPAEVRAGVKRAGGTAVIGKPCSVEEVRALLDRYRGSSAAELSA
jgi:CheY-like chemotaxis protein